MIIALIIVASIFFLLSFLITVDNSALLLSGYNTMSAEEKSHVDIVGYVGHFRRFYRIFSITYFIIGVVLYYFIDVDIAGVFLAIGPLLGVFIQSIAAAKFNIQNNNRSAKVVGSILIGLTLLVLGLIWLGYKENSIVFEKDGILITSAYGERIAYSEIASVSLVDSLPAIQSKTDGFALGSNAKGIFETKSGNTVKLLLNNKEAPFLLLTKTNHQQVYIHNTAAGTVSAYVSLLQHLQAK